jgi:hypothetical protein
MLGLWILKATAGVENIRSRPMQHAQPIQSASPVWAFILSGPPLSVMRFLTYKDLCEMTHCSCVSLRFRSWMLRFCSTDGTSGRYYMSSQFLPVSLNWCTCNWFCWLWLWHKCLPSFLSQFHTCGCFVITFTADFLVISRRISLGSSN